MQLIQLLGLARRLQMTVTNRGLNLKQYMKLEDNVTDFLLTV